MPPLPDGALFAGWMFKQGHVVPNWKHRFFVLMPKSLDYYDEPPMVAVNQANALTGKKSIPLSKALVYPEAWAPRGLFGWLVTTAKGIAFPLRCAVHGEREVSRADALESRGKRRWCCAKDLRQGWGK